MSKRKRGIICAYCGIAWGYDDESPTPELIKEACDHESICEKNPYTAQIRKLEREFNRLAEVIEAASVLIAAKGQYHTILAYNGLRDALQSLTRDELSNQ